MSDVFLTSSVITLSMQIRAKKGVCVWWGEGGARQSCLECGMLTDVNLEMNYGLGGKFRVRAENVMLSGHAIW